MKRMLAAVVLASFGLAPIVGTACEYEAASMTPAEQLGLAAPPPATKAPAATVAKTTTSKSKSAQAKAKQAPADAKLRIAATN